MRPILLVVLFASLGQGAGKWELQYFYDKLDSQLVFQDLAFPSEQRGIAIGTLTEKGRERPVVVLTGDGGRTWEMQRLRETPISLFFLNDSLGWMVTEKGIWQTQEAGRDWKKLKGIRDMIRVYFITPEHGWAIGGKKQVLETHDGGSEWTRVAAADAPKGNPKDSAYRCIDFATPQVGIIVGSSKPSRRNEPRLPAWIDPEGGKRPEWPTLTLLLQTADSGKNWQASNSSLFGTVTSIDFRRDGSGLALFQFHGSFQYPAEVYRVDLRTGRSDRVFRQKDRAVTDLVWIPDGPAYLGAIEPPGTLMHLPVPGRVRILSSDDLSKWSEMEVDYRATATGVIMAAAGPDNIWAATDTGMILKLNRKPATQ